MRRPLSEIGDHSIAILGLLVAWALYTHFGHVPPYMLPPPEAVEQSLAKALHSGDIWGNILFTVSNLIIGFAIGALAGAACGVALAHFPRLEQWLEGPILILQTAPRIALAPLFVIWFGFGATSKIILILSLVIFPVMIATLLGLRSVDPRFGDLARIIKLSPSQRLFRIELPAALPEIFVGLRIGAIQAIVGAVVGEWMAGRSGLGALMTYASATYNTPLLYGAVLLVILLGLIVHALLGLAERSLLSWRA